MDQNKNDRKKFQSNKKYFTICTYVVITFSICLLIFRFTENWTQTKSTVSGITAMLAPFLIAFLLVYIVTPMVKHIDRFLFGRFRMEDQQMAWFSKLHRAISLIIAYAIIVGAIVLILTFVIPQLITSISQLISQSTQLYNNIESNFKAFSTAHPNMNLDSIERLVEENLPQLFDYLKNYLNDLVPMIYEAGRSAVSWVVNILLAFVISCYLLWGKDRMLGSIKRLIHVFWNEKNAMIIIRNTKECNRIFSQYIIGKALDSLIIGILCFVLMSIMNLPYALIISVFVGITNMIPYFGPFIGAIPGVLLLLIIDPTKCIVFGIMIIVLQQFDGAILGPKILGSSTGLQPIWIIFAILAGSYVAGVLGMFIGVPVIAVIAYLLNNLVDYLIKRKRMREDPSYDGEPVIPRMSDEEIGFAYEQLD